MSQLVNSQAALFADLVNLQATNFLSDISAN